MSGDGRCPHVTAPNSACRCSQPVAEGSRRPGDLRSVQPGNRSNPSEGSDVMTSRLEQAHTDFGRLAPARSESWAGWPMRPPLKKGLKVFVIPKNLGNPYFTTADSAKSGGAIAALTTLGETGDRDQRHGSHARLPDPGHPGRDHQGRQHLIVSATDPHGALPDAEVGDGQGHHRRHLRLRRADLPDLFINQASTAGDRRPARWTCSPRRSTTPGRSRSSRLPPRRRTRTPGSGT